MGEIFVGCVMCDVEILKRDCTRKWEGSINMKGYYKNDSEKVLTLGITIDVLIKDFGEGKLSDDKKLSKMEEDMLLLNEIDIQYIMSTMEINLIDQLIK